MQAQPLAQEYVVVGQSPAEDMITDDPSLVKLTSGRLLATYTVRYISGEAAWTNPQRFRLARSDDNGQTWQGLPPLEINMGLPFLHEGKLYLLGNAMGRKDIILLTSDDEGETWSPPITLFEGNYWNAPAGVAIAEGRLYRAFGTLGDDGLWDQTVVVAGELSADLCDPKAWRISNPLAYPGTPRELVANVYPVGPTRKLRDHWLEPNVVNVNERVRVLIRIRMDGYATSSMCGVCDVQDDGATLDYRFTQFHPLPGAQNQFHIFRDEKSKLFWMTGNLPTDAQDALGRLAKRKEAGFKGLGGNERRFLMLHYSLDALNWFSAGCIAMIDNPLQSFHYAWPLIDGDDLLILSRTSRNAKNQHDSDLITFHTLEKFRSLALDLYGEF